ncbi:MAG: hypothetical protein HFI81_10150 [Eubacterium sp.]|nr:hypothetical protein [Eubacterium sp.]
MKKFVALIKRFLNLIAKEIIEINTTDGSLSFMFNVKKYMNNFTFV